MTFENRLKMVESRILTDDKNVDRQMDILFNDVDFRKPLSPEKEIEILGLMSKSKKYQRMHKQLSHLPVEKLERMIVTAKDNLKC